MEDNYIIYIHTSPSGKKYIGQTKNYKRRCNDHKRGCENHPFSNAIKKYNWNNFTHELWAEGLSLEEANTYEEFLIDYYNTISPKGYNLDTGGLNHKTHEETKKKQSIAKKGKPSNRLGYRHSEETKAKLSAAAKGIKRKPHSEETKAKLSALKQGKKRPPMSEEQKAKISASVERTKNKHKQEMLNC